MEEHLEDTRMEGKRFNCLLLPSNHIPKTNFIKSPRFHPLLLYNIYSDCNLWLGTVCNEGLSFNKYLSSTY